jgi:hypothetical protein
MTLRLYHRARPELVNEILSDRLLVDNHGFYAGSKHHPLYKPDTSPGMLGGEVGEWSGVHLSNAPDNNPPESGTLLELLLDATEESLVAWEQDGELVFPKTRKGYRWWLMPATVINPLISEIRVVPDSTLEN